MSSMSRNTRFNAGVGTLRCQVSPIDDDCGTHNIVEQVTILTQLTDEHARDLGRVLGNADATLYCSVSISSSETYESDDIRMAELS